MPNEPMQKEVEAQLELMWTTVDGFATSQYGQLLRYLVRIKREGRYEKGSPTTKDILSGFYQHELGEKNISGTEGKCRQLVKQLRDAVDLYYYRLDPNSNDRVTILIPEGSGSGHQPIYSYRMEGDRKEGHFRNLGNCIEAMTEFIKLIPTSSRIEDTTLRWHETSSQSQYPTDLMDKFSGALRLNDDLVFNSITGPIIDVHYARALANAFKQQPGRLQARRLHHTSPLMNFTIFYPQSETTQRKTVFFGYGKHTGQGFDLKDTSVFASQNETLIKEYQRLFTVLRSDDVSSPITADDPDFSVSLGYKCDVLATFQEWPNEISKRIRDCRSSVKICTAGWSHLDTHLQALYRALQRGKSVEIGVWDPNSKFVEFRAECLLNTKTTISNNLASLKQLGERNNLKIAQCDGWGSASIFWIDEHIYYGLYWTDTSTLQGPFFLVNADSLTGKHFQREYAVMTRAQSGGGSIG